MSLPVLPVNEIDVPIVLTHKKPLNTFKIVPLLGIHLFCDNLYIFHYNTSCFFLAHCKVINKDLYYMRYIYHNNNV